MLFHFGYPFLIYCGIDVPIPSFISYFFIKQRGFVTSPGKPNGECAYLKIIGLLYLHMQVSENL